MRKNRIFGALTASALLLAGACSNEIMEQNKNQGGLLNTDETSGGVYLSVDFKMPTGYEGTRSETLDPEAPDNENKYNSSGGTEVGTDAENFVSSALIVLAASEAKPDSQIEKYGFIVAGEVPSNRIATATSEGGKQYKATARLQKENLNIIYSTYGDGQVPEVYVFVFANPTSELLSMFDGDNTKFGDASWINATCEVLQSTDATQSKNIGIWGSNSFLMNNVKLATRELPKNLLDWENFSSIERPFHLSSTNNGGGYEAI